MTVAVTTGLAAGAMLSGLLGASLIQNFGWQAVFVVGGVLPLLLAPALWMWLPEAPGFQSGLRAPSSAKVWSGFSRLFSNEFAARTLFIVGLFVPDLHDQLRSDIVDTDFAGKFRLYTGARPDRCSGARHPRRRRHMILMFPAPKFGEGAFSLRRNFLPSPPFSALLGRFAKRSAASHARRYRCGASRKLGRPSRARGLDLSSDLRTTGVGCSSALGRFGSIVGPGLGGLMLSIGWPAREIVHWRPCQCRWRS